MVSGQKIVVSGQWAVGSGQKTVITDHWSLITDHWLVAGSRISPSSVRTLQKLPVSLQKLSPFIRNSSMNRGRHIAEACSGRLQP